MSLIRNIKKRLLEYVFCLCSLSPGLDSSDDSSARDGKLFGSVSRPSKVSSASKAIVRVTLELLKARTDREHSPYASARVRRPPSAKVAWKTTLS
jgi:hypothetical protein